MRLGLGSMNLEDEGGAGRRQNRAHRPLPSILTFGGGPHLKTSKYGGMGQKGLRRLPTKSQTKPKLIPEVVEACPQLHSRLPARLSQHSWLEEGPWKGTVLPTAGRQGGGRGAARRLLTIWEPPPDLRGACPRLDLSRKGEEESRGLASVRPV